MLNFKKLPHKIVRDAVIASRIVLFVLGRVGALGHGVIIVFKLPQLFKISSGQLGQILLSGQSHPRAQETALILSLCALIACGSAMIAIAIAIAIALSYPRLNA